MAGKTKRSGPMVDVIPYPQEVELRPGVTLLGPSTKIRLPPNPDARERLAATMLSKVLSAEGGEGAAGGTSATVWLGSLTDKGGAFTRLDDSQREFLRSSESDQAYVLLVDAHGATVVGKTSTGTLHGVQTLLQLAREKRGASRAVRRLEVRDFPSVENRYLSIAMSWYTGYGRVGFGSQLWGREQWFWFIDWCSRHKVNGVNLCMYGFYPFRFEAYPETVFRDLEVTTWLGEAGTEAKVRYTHPNVEDEFLPALIAYANARGITVLAYVGLNTFNGGYAIAHPESRYWSPNPEKFRQFRYNLCPSRADVRRYFDATIRRILDIGFNGIVLEESEGSGFCECDACKRSYYQGGADSRTALHRADAQLFNHLYSVAKKHRPGSTVGIRAWRMGSETGVESLREARDQIPDDTLVFWSNGMDPGRFEGWVDVFGPERIMGQDAETMGFSTLYDGLVYMFPRQYSSYLKHVDPSYKPSYPQCLPNDVAQYILAARHRCGGVTGYAFNWNGWELAPLALAEYGWNSSLSTISLERFVEFGYRHQFGEIGSVVAKAVYDLPIVLETRICEGFKRVPRDDPVSGGLVGLTSLQVPTRFGKGEGETAALVADLAKAASSVALLASLGARDMQEQDRITLRYLERAAERTVCICMAGIEYRKALAAMESGSPSRLVSARLSAALSWTLEDYRILREGAFDLGEEFHQRVFDAIGTIARRLRKVDPAALQAFADEIPSR